MSRKSKRNAQRGTYALCISTGLIIGVGLGPALGSVTLTAAAGALVGVVAGYLFNHRNTRS